MKTSKTYIRELDYIRTLSIIFVVLYHYTTRYQETIGRVDAWAINFPWGCWGVNTLFVLTAYLLAHMLLVTERGHCFVIGCVIALLKKNKERKYLILTMPMIMFSLIIAVINMGCCIMDLPMVIVTFLSFAAEIEICVARKKNR